MHDLTGIDMFTVDCDAICITTNGFVKANGECVMGRGCALELAKLFPRAPRILGSMIQQWGNRVQPILMANGTYAVAFPVKHIQSICDGTNVVSHSAHI